MLKTGKLLNYVYKNFYNMEVYFHKPKTEVSNLVDSLEMGEGREEQRSEWISMFSDKSEG